MSILAIKHRILVIVASLAALAALFGLSAEAASASTPARTSADAARHTAAPRPLSAVGYGNTAYLPGYGDSNDFPTWFTGTTQLCATNLGDQYGIIRVQSWSPFAGPEYMSIAPHATTCIYRYWVGVPVRGTNLSNDAPLQVTAR